MSIIVIDPTVAANVAAAVSQTDQRAALFAPFGSADVTVRALNGATLRETQTYSAWVFNTATPRGATLGNLIVRTVSSTGAPTSFVFRAGSTDVFSMTGAVAPGTADIVLAANIAVGPRTNLADGSVSKLTISANPALPVTSAVATAFTLTLSASAGTNGVAITATVVPNGPVQTGGASVALAASNGGTLGSTSLSFTSGSTAAQSTTLMRAATGATVVTMTNNIGLANNGSGATFTSAAPASTGLPAWLTAPAGQWAQISGTASTHMLRDYSGVAFVESASSLKIVAGLGGGHNGNATDNSVHGITLSADAPAWSQLRPSSSAAGYNSSTMSYFPADGSPGPRHLYHGIVHWPERNAVIFGGLYWAFNGTDTSNMPSVDGFSLTSNTFEQSSPPSVYPERIEGPRSKGAWFEWQWSVVNSADGYLYAARQDGGSQLVGKKMHPTTLAVTNWHPASGGALPHSPWLVEDKRRASGVYFGVGNGEYWNNTIACGFIEFASGTKTAVSLDTSSAAYANFAANVAAVNPLNGSINGVYISPALARDEQADCYYWYNGADGAATEGQRVYKLTPEESGSWFLSAIDGAGVTVPSTVNPGVSVTGTYSMHFSEKWRTLILPRNRGNNIHYLKVPFSSLLYVRSGSVTGSVPYTATVLPLRGEVPSGYTVTSADDATLKASVISTHDDGSAAVVVLAGATTVTVNTTKRLALGIAATSADTALTAARIDALVTSVTVDFAGTYGSVSIIDFNTPELVWWANSKVICARYRIAAPTPGSTALEAVIDITSYGTGHDRALVEVVIENGKLDALASTTSAPADATYTGATVTINGTTVTTVNSSAAPTGTHQAFRSWYAKGWVGGDPETRATQRHIDLQRHPLFWRMDKNNASDLSVYASDAYAPWGTGRHRASNMGGGSDDDTLGPLTAWDSRALQTGDYRCWNAAEQNALAILSYNVNYRDSVTGLVPDAARMPNKFTGSGGNWPWTQDPSGTRGMFEAAHQPAAGLIAFVSRPSPVFIEIAQKIAVWTGTDNNTTERLTDMGSLATAVALTDMTGITPMGQVRGYAWGMRQTAHATFLSPDGSTWRAGGRVWLGRIARYGKAVSNNPKATLNVAIWPYPGQYSDHESMPGYQTAEWMHHFLVGEAHRASSVGLISGTTEKTYMTEFADWLAISAARFVNEQTDGGWRYVPYSSSHLRADLSTFSDYTERRNYDIPSWTPPTVAGQFYAYPTNKTTAAEVNALGFESSSASGTYPVQFWSALVVAVERGVPGAATAWSTVKTSLTGLDTWRAGFATAPKYGSWPRKNI